MSSSKSARGVRFTATGGPDVLQIQNLRVASPAVHEVRIKVKAIGLNRSDVMYRTGYYVEKPIFPAGLGYEAAGIVDAVGADVQHVQVGDVVSVIAAFSLHDYGTYGELINVPDYTVIKHDASLSYEEAAAVWVSYLSMYGLLIDTAKIQAGQAVIFTAASSSAGLSAIQMTNYVGGTAIAITSSAPKKEAILEAGAHHVLVSGEDDIVAAVNEITGGKGADIVLDAVGGPLFAELIGATASRGQVFVYGAMSTEPTPFPMLEVLTKLPTIRGYTSMDLMLNQASLQAAIAFINEGIAEGKLKPVIGKTFPFGSIVEATRFLESNRHVGKVVVTV
ncbi:zinc-dependent alcohol dehydrogenase family protein [Spirosoma utsteinense]|uniref:zinc-dependent alcohol dehydrogenase family protein n=1 Tax=Spirosoma utsteinense TaxID=2585773 RepID=UPI0016494C78|nr:zinc-dependent alcohol dehydrogenase family protein [Spirosoma utsteinense]MBC3788877.1 NADPH:quinone reductase-like Zn-dependent oxidoreductase [Spirosoma utsteinense]